MANTSFAFGGVINTADTTSVTILNAGQYTVVPNQDITINCSTGGEAGTLIGLPVSFMFLPSDDGLPARHLAVNTELVDVLASRHSVTFYSAGQQFIFVLTIKGATHEDSGTYICSRINNATTRITVVESFVNEVTEVSLTSPTPKTCTCSDGYIRYGHSCYRFHHQMLSWPESSYFCQILGSRLAEVPTEEEFEFIRGFALDFEESVNSTGVWLGGVSSLLPGQYMWVSNKHPVGVDSMLARNISYDTMHLCLSLSKAKSFHLGGEECQQNKFFLCQVPKVCGDI